MAKVFKEDATTEGACRISSISGVRPEGNFYLDGVRNIRNCGGLGAFQVLSDVQVADLLEYLCPASLSQLMQTSKTFYAFCTAEDLWMQFVVEKCKPVHQFNGSSWRSTYASLYSPTGSWMSRQQPIAVSGLYSDLLFHRWLYSTADIDVSWLKRERIPRVDAREISSEAFRRDYILPGRPVIVTGVVSTWPAVARWSREYFLSVSPKDAMYETGCANMTLSAFFEYASSNHDEAPLCLFDPHFASTAPQLAEDYTAPDFFKDDLFSLLSDRPNYRWLLLGNRKSGSKWHVDPNGTHAWNGVVKGAKRWLFFPPHIPPPGVFPSDDNANVTQPLSLIEWYTNFYHAAATGAAGVPLIEGTCYAGELVFVPREWWHAVINLEDDTFAVTQNCVTPEICPLVRSFLHFRRDCVSGVPEERKQTLWKEFDEALERHRPDLLTPLSKVYASSPTAEPVQESSRSSANSLDSVRLCNALQHPPRQPQSEGANGASFWDQLRAKKKRIVFNKAE